MAWKLKMWKIRHRKGWEAFKGIGQLFGVLLLFALIASLDEILTWF